MVGGCGVCGQPSSDVCGKCREAYYCCVEHQRKDWKKHKVICADLSKDKGNSKGSEWVYFDFQANWQRFLEIWKSEEIQALLDKEMVVWCKKEAYFLHDEKGKKYKPKWEKQPLWSLGKTDHWDTIITEKINNLPKSEFEKYKENLRSQGKVVEEPEDEFDENPVFDDYFDEKYEEFSPKPDTIESFIMVMGKNYLSSPLKATACVFFGEKDVLMCEGERGGDLVLVPEERIIFDLFDYYFENFDKHEEHKQPDEYYDNCVLRFGKIHKRNKTK